jgi:hypothetical protein
MGVPRSKSIKLHIDCIVVRSCRLAKTGGLAGFAF